MAFNNRKSWRLRFIDIDQSFVLNESEDEIIGYFAIRAPKGNQRPTYFPKDNGQAIDALVGLASANWPDITEVKAYNAEYPCYVSAPAGSSKAYPSYLGGFYFTKDGIYKFYNVTSKQELADGTGNAFKVKVQPGREEQFKPEFATKRTQIVVAGPTVPAYTPSEDQIGYGFFSMETADEYSISFKKNGKLNVTAIDYDTMRQGLVSSVGTDTTYWGDNDGLWDFKKNTATLVDFGRVYATEEKADPEFNALRDWIGKDNYEGVADDAEALAELLLNGYVTVDDEAYSIAFGIQNTFTFLVDIMDDVLIYFNQKSPTEVKTLIDITNIGYDKYYYQKLLNYAPYDIDEFEKTGHLVVGKTETLNEAEKAKLEEAISNNDYLGFYRPGKEDQGIYFIGRYTEDEETGKVYYEVSDDLNTQYIAFQDALVGGKVGSIYHKFYRPSTGADVVHILTEEEEIELWGEIDGPLNYTNDLSTFKAVPVSPTFNQITFECSEEVYAGQTTSGGQFTGSMDELGVNTYGNTNYFPELISDDDQSFVEVRVLRKIGDEAGDLDEGGFWQHSRIVDPYDIDKDGTSPVEKKFYIEGDRYCTMVMQQNLAMRKAGGAWNEGYKQIIIDALTEAKLGEYDDAYMFVECTGQECFKPYLADISRVQENAATISPKILYPNAKNIVTNIIASKVIVNDRVNEGCNALFAGEFEVYDDVTKTKYWRQPIGSVAKMLARIYDKRFGGAAPAWTNENNIGGQLEDVKAIRSRYQLDEDAEKTLDEKGVNPIVMTTEEGVMIVSQKTTRDPNMLSDWSWIGHALSFLLVRREIRDKVMRQQVMKPINSYYMSKRQLEVEAILAKRTTGDNPVWTEATCDIAGVNTPYTKAQRDFVIKVEIKVTPFSETVTLKLVHKSQEA